jgi:hypothetical protein
VSVAWLLVNAPVEGLILFVVAPDTGSPAATSLA